jgi:hypothetical protein
MGFVEIKMTKDDQSQDIYAKQQIITGQILLVRNTVFVSYEDKSSGINVDH